MSRTSADCMVERCDRPVKTRGYCKSHYWRARRRGLPRLPRRSLAERFWSKVDKTAGLNGCWPWMSNVGSNGYGVFFLTEGRHQSAHRLAFTLAKGPIPAGLDIDHVCHNQDETCRAGVHCPHRRCCNPRHLRAVTRSVNVKAGRSTRGRRSPRPRCPRGHRMVKTNVYVTPDGRRQCKECRRFRGRRAWAAKRGHLGRPETKEG